ncbi:MAG: hypothetical protein K8F54_05180 [Altibacter sp.]|uniref:hypothetical protein n=1 Tax=Altibacter sp. TaxID=2024823 RepID=UPI001D3B0AC2|nr:hypothetical protein [Altibacter sp.]MBZ0326976.1 hypothetical protein [Altibacter sp.]
MKKLTLLIVALVFMTGCKNDTKKNEESSAVPIETTSKVACTREATFGDVTFCFPNIEGQTECYTHPVINTRVNAFNDPDNEILGYYISNTNYENVDNLDGVSYDDYYQIYAPNLAKNYRMTTAEMNQIMGMMTTGFLDKTMDEVNESDSFSKNDIAITQPMLIEKYTLNSNSSTMIVLMSITNTSENKTMAVSMNALIVKDRIVFVTHYLDYKDDASITSLKKNTAHFVEKFMDANS